MPVSLSFPFMIILLICNLLMLEFAKETKLSFEQRCEYQILQPVCVFA